MSFWEVLSKAGWTLWPLLITSIAALTIFLERVLFYRELKLSSISWLEQLFSSVDSENWPSASEVIRAHSRHPLARVLSGTIQTWLKKPERAESEAKRLAELELHRLERFLDLLAFLAQLAPLLGLFGTVVGMIELFFDLQNLTSSELQISQLASGIWKALLTTAIGLMIAIPAQAAHLYLTKKVEYFRLILEDSLVKLFNILPKKR